LDIFNTKDTQDHEGIHLHLFPSRHFVPFVVDAFFVLWTRVTIP